VGVTAMFISANIRRSAGSAGGSLGLEFYGCDFNITDSREAAGGRVEFRRDGADGLQH